MKLLFRCMSALVAIRALGLLLLLAGTSSLQASPAPLNAAPQAAAAGAVTAAAAVPDAASTAAAVATRAAAVAARAATAAPLAGADCAINIAGDSRGGISRASMECSGGPVRVGAHPSMLAALKQNFNGVVWDPECARPKCLVRFCGNTTVSLSNSMIVGVVFAGARAAHAVVCVADSAQVVLRNTSISSNNATAIVVWDEARLHVFGSTLAANTAYGQPGGVLAVNSSTVVVSGGSVISGNTALDASGGGVGVNDSAVCVLSGGSRIVNNTSVGGSGGGLAVVGRGEARIEGNSIVCNNTCLFDGGGDEGGGGGVAVAGQGQLALVGNTVLCNNMGGYRGGGMTVTGNATVTIHNSSISGNTAYASGGGIVVSNSSRVAVFDSTIKNNTSIEGRSASLGGGAVAVLGAAKVQLFNGTRLLGNRAVGLPGGAFVLDAAASLLVATGVQLSDNAVVANTSSRVAPYGADGVAVKSSTLQIEPGVLGQRGPLTKCSRSVVLFRRPCGVGEFDGGEGSTCLCCPPFTYGFEPNVTSCRECPVNAECYADIVRPVPGYWHSSPRSLQMHKCPVPKSCGQGGVCSPGHTGNLCGQCAKGFGTTSPLQCGKCLAPGLPLGIFLLWMGVMVWLMSITVNGTWHDNIRMDRSLRSADLMKVLVQYCQYVSILSYVSIPWPAFLTPHVGLANSAATYLGVGLMLDCWLPHFVSSKAPLALQRMLVPFVCAFLGTLACVVLVNLPHVLSRVRNCIARNNSQQPPSLHFLSKLRVTLLVTAFFEYPTLARAALSLFACLPIDVAGHQPHPEYAIRNHSLGYWVSDIQQECFAGWHRPWALYFGVPVAVLLCIGVPVGLFVFLRCSKMKTSDPLFWEHYGFLFRNYKESKPWWEAVWTAQTVMMVAVSVFHFTFQAYYALLVMQMILLLSATVQVIAQPYEEPLLHRVHLVSTCCLSLVVWLCLALFSASVEADSNVLNYVHTAFGAVGLLLVAGCFLWILSLILRAMKGYFKMLRAYISYIARSLLRRYRKGLMLVGCCQPREAPWPEFHSGQPNWARSEFPLVLVIEHDVAEDVSMEQGDVEQGVMEQGSAEQGDTEQGGLEGGGKVCGGLEEGGIELGGMEGGGTEHGVTQQGMEGGDIRESGMDGGGMEHGGVGGVGMHQGGMGLGEIQVCDSDDDF